METPDGGSTQFKMQQQQSQARAAQLKTFNPGHSPYAAAIPAAVPTVHPTPRWPRQTGLTLCVIPSYLTRGNPTHSRMRRPPHKDTPTKTETPHCPWRKRPKCGQLRKQGVAILNATRGQGESEKKGHRKAGPADPEESTSSCSLHGAGPGWRKFLTSKRHLRPRNKLIQISRKQILWGQTQKRSRLWAISVCFKEKSGPFCPI